MNKYTFKTSHVPIPLEYSLYKISKDRSADWELIHELLTTNEEQLARLRSKNEDKSKWFSRIMASWSLGQLLEECLTGLQPTCTLNMVLCDLIEDYNPIKVRFLFLFSMIHCVIQKLANGHLSVFRVHSVEDRV